MGYANATVITAKGTKDINENTPLYFSADETKSEKTEIKFIPYYLWGNRGLGEMKVWMRRLVTLSVVLLAFVLAGCGGRGSETASTPTPAPTPAPTQNAAASTNNNGGAEETSTPEPIRQVDGGYRETLMDLGGREITVATTHFNNFNYWDPIDATPNETLGIIAKLREIENDYNMLFNFEAHINAGVMITSVILNRVLGETSIDVVNLGTNQTALDPVFQQGLMLDLKHPSVAHIIDFDNQPWEEASKLTYLFGAQYGVNFHLANSGQLVRASITFNRDFVDLFSLPNLYDMVWNHTWTFTNAESIWRQIHQASHGQVRPLVADRFSQFVPHAIIANGGQQVANTPDGFVYVAHEDERTLEAMTWIQSLISNNLLVFDVEPVTLWMANGEAMMRSGTYEVLRAITRQQVPTDYNFGLLPIPKGDHMDDYVSPIPAADMFFIVNDIPRPNEVAAVLVAMANRLSKINIIETELNFGVQDMESARILEMLLARTVIDYNGMTTARNRMGDAVNVIARLEATPRQAFEEIAQTVQMTLDGVRPREQ
jgi:hypothetical protein